MHQSTTSTRQHPKQKSRAYTFRPSTLREPTRSTWGPGERVLNSPGFPAVTFSQRKQGWKLMKPQLALMASRDSSRERERELHPRYETHYTHTELRWFFNKNEGINFTKFSNPIPIKKEKERGKKVSLHGGETRSVFIRMLFRRFIHRGDWIIKLVLNLKQSRLYRRAFVLHSFLFFVSLRRKRLNYYIEPRLGETLPTLAEMRLLFMRMMPRSSHLYVK